MSHEMRSRLFLHARGNVVTSPPGNRAPTLVHTRGPYFSDDFSSGTKSLGFVDSSKIPFVWGNDLLARSPRDLLQRDLEIEIKKSWIEREIGKVTSKSYFDSCKKLSVKITKLYQKKFLNINCILLMQLMLHY